MSTVVAFIDCNYLFYLDIPKKPLLRHSDKAHFEGDSEFIYKATSFIELHASSLNLELHAPI